MNIKTILPTLAGLSLAFTIAACKPPLSGNIAPGIITKPTQTVIAPTASGPVYPLVPPDPQQGQVIYTEKCAPCHGDNGLGNGPQASRLPDAVKSIGSADEIRQSTPAEWFTVITKGNMAKFMMPFGDSLNERQRWDVLAYVYSLSATDKILAEGKAVYDASCAACHNKSIKNVSAQSRSLSSDLANQERMASLSEAAMFKTISDGIHPNMPAYASALSEDQRWAVSSYVRALTFMIQNAASPSANLLANSATSPIMAAADSPTAAAATTATTDPTPAAATAQAQDSSTSGTPQASQKGSVSGAITPPTGETLPAGLTVVLIGSDNSQIDVSKTTPVQADGSFMFNDIDMPAGRVFMTYVIFNEYEFDSDIATIADSRSLTLPITLYETSTDKSPLVSESMHVLFDFGQPGLVQIIELFVISNPTAKMIVADQPGQPVLEFALPAGISNLQLDEGQLGQRYIKTSAGIGDTAGIKPGTRQTQVGFTYSLPYVDSLDLSIPAPIPTNMVTFMLSTNSIKLQSSLLKAAGSQSAQGMVLYLYSSSNLKAGQTIDVSLSGRPSAVVTPSTGSPNTTIWIGAGIFALALGASGYFIIQSRRNQSRAAQVNIEEPEVEEDVDSLLDAIAALDDMHASGELPDPPYQQRRAELKAKLTMLYKPPSDESSG